MEFKAFEEGIEVSGNAVSAFIAGFKFTTIPAMILLKNGIGQKSIDGKITVDLHEWYPQQAWLNAFEEIADTTGDAILYQIGLKIPDSALLPDTGSSMESSMRAIDIAYHMNHRKNGVVMYDADTGAMLEGIGHYGFTPVKNKNRIISVCDTPYPCEFDKGIITAMARKFRVNITVEKDDSQACRKNGNNSCTYIVEW
ncbi:MAG: hypothetical protein GY754_35365 [bacterium]|nr:hypothetical protein [bacterium]